MRFLRYQGFRQWLEELHDRRITLGQFIVTSCPIATYLNEKKKPDQGEFSVSKATYGEHGQGHTRKLLPVWAMEFQREMEESILHRLPPQGINYTGVSWDRQELLDMLDRAVEAANALPDTTPVRYPHINREKEKNHE